VLPSPAEDIDPAEDELRVDEPVEAALELALALDRTLVDSVVPPAGPRLLATDADAEDVCSVGPLPADPPAPHAATSAPRMRSCTSPATVVRDEVVVAGFVVREQPSTTPGCIG
jgi:hypothetical protein